MKKVILSFSVVLFSLAAMAQNPQFFRSMGETLAQYSTCKSVADFQSLGNKFQRISNAEKNEWLPLYYYAHCYILMSFIDQTDTAQKDNYLDVAEKTVEKLIELAPSEPEVHALQSFYYTARLVVNPMERGQKFSRLSNQAIAKALKLDATNPRAQLLKIQGDMGSARFFGKDPNTFCPQAADLLAKWDDFKPKSPIYPVWGKDQVEEIVKGCR